MEHIIALLLYKLSHKGLTPVEIPRIVRDVLNIISSGGEITTSIISRKQEMLGWDKPWLIHSPPASLWHFWKMVGLIRRSAPRQIL